MKLAHALLLLVSAAAFSAAVSTQTQSLTGKASEVEKLVDVESDFSLEKLVPGSEYKASLSVRFAIAGESLKNFNEERVAVSVVAKGSREDSWVYFKGTDGRSANKFKNVFLKLECVVENNGCGEKSVLEKSIPVFYFAPGGVQEEREDGVVVEASLKPFREQELLAQAEEKSKELEVVAAAAGGTAGRAAANEVEAARAALEKAREAGGDDGSALAAVETALRQEKAAESEQQFIVESGATGETPAGEEAQANKLPSPVSGSVIFAQENFLLGIAVLAAAAIGVWHWRNRQARKRQPFDN